MLNHKGKKDIQIIILNAPHLKKITDGSRHRKFWKINKMFCMFINIGQNIIHLQDLLPPRF